MDSSQAATALITEHLQYTPLSLIDDIIDSVNNFVYQGVGSLETGLFAIPPERLGFKPASMNGDGDAQAEARYPEAKQEIEEGLHKLETLLNSTIDRNFDKFEIYVLRNIMSVPADNVSWIRLSHYEGIELPLPAGAPTSESIDLLRQKLIASRKINKALQTEKRRNEVILTQLKNIVNSITETSQAPNFSFLSNNDAAHVLGGQSQYPLTTNTTFTVSQLPALRSVVRELREQLANLKDASQVPIKAMDEVREERREYIEQRTQAHLQRNGQIITDHTEITGRVMNPAEIEALENVADKLKEK